MLRTGCDALAVGDPRLEALLQLNGEPPLRLRPEGFATLVHLILQQQVSRASAQAVFDRLTAAAGGEVTADSVLAVDPEQLRAVGFSYQKIEYVTSLAEEVRSGELDLAALASASDEEAAATLSGRRGIGPWTAAVYVLTALGRPDVWAPGDRALLVSLGRMLDQTSVPSSADAEVVALQWQPWRAVAARILWHDYAAREAR